MPAFAQEAESSYASSTVSITTPPFNVIVGDLIVALGLLPVNGGQTPPTALTISDSSGLTWLQQQVVTTVGFPRLGVWTCVVEQEIAGLTVTMTRDAVSQQIAVDALTFRSAAVGASGQATATISTPSLVITTAAADSSILVFNVDSGLVDDGSPRVWRTGAGAVTEVTYYKDARWVVYIGTHDDVTVPGTYTVGLSAPGNQVYSLVALEILDVAPLPPPEQTDLIELTNRR